MYAEPNANAKVEVGFLQGTLRRIEGKIDTLHDLISRVEQAANLIETQPTEMKAGKIGDAPRPMLTLSRLENDIDNELARLIPALNILS